ncbi:hypothetical protein [Terribacillus saccharophilus]|uniref:hypothetical protein n=1 Tax=Terribacillus saccharophilus TaxID=361277 RepID=UPI000BA6E3EB|nr:hypothetical protein [Terribacillus saccharophilus]
MMKARDADEKAAVALESLAENIQKELKTMQTRLFDKAKAFRAERSHTHILFCLKQSRPTQDIQSG